jgi:Protein of unknown function (DUF3326)
LKFYFFSVLQANALGGASVLSFLSRHLESATDDIGEGKTSMRRNGKKEVLIIAVQENETAMKVTAPALLSKSGEDDLFRNVVYARSYAECAGILAAHKAGILLSSISSFVPKIKVTRM